MLAALLVLAGVGLLAGQPAEPPGAARFQTLVVVQPNALATTTKQPHEQVDQRQVSIGAWATSQPSQQAERQNPNPNPNPNPNQLWSQREEQHQRHERNQSKLNNREATCDLGGRLLRVAVSPQPPLVNCAQSSLGDWTCNGSNIELIHLLERRFHFRAEWVVLAQTSPSRRTPNELHRTGVELLVASGRAWLSANGLISTESRLTGELAQAEAGQAQGDQLLLSEPFDSFRFHLLLSKSVRDHQHIFVKPFSSHVWLAILASALLMGPLFYLFDRSSHHYALMDDPVLARLPFWSCLWHLLRRRCGCCAGSDGGRADGDELFERYRQQARVRAQRRAWLRARKRALKRSRRSRRTGFHRLAYTAWYVLGSLSNQGGEEENLPSADSTRILVAAWWLYLVVLCSFHSGILTAILTFPKQVDFIQSLEQFLQLDGRELRAWRLWLDRDGELAQLLLGPPSGLLAQSPLQALVNQSQRGLAPLRPADFSRQRQRILDDVQAGQAAYLDERSHLDLIISQEFGEQQRCLLKASRQPLDTRPMRLALSARLGPACVARINGLLRQVWRAGLAQRWRRSFAPPGNQCLQPVLINAGDVAKISLAQVELGLWLLGSGLLLGAFLLLAEVVWLFTADLDDDSSDSSDSSRSSRSSRSSDPSEPSLGSPVRLRLGFRPRSGPNSAPSGERGPSGRGALRSQRLAGLRGPVKRRQRPTRRARRLQRTLELVRRLNQGKIYSEFLSKVSGQVQSRARRASQAFVQQLRPNQVRPAPGQQRRLPVLAAPELGVAGERRRTAEAIQEVRARVRPAKSRPTVHTQIRS